MSGRSLTRVISVYGLPLLLVALIVVFSLLLPRTFPTTLTFRGILFDRSVVAILALGVMIPMATGNWDLSIGFNVGLTHILAVGLQVQHGVPWPLAVVLVLIVGMVIGTVNGLLVTRAHMDSFIASLGVGTVLFGLASWYTGGQQIVGSLDSQFTTIGASAGDLPLPAIYVLALTVALFVLFEFLPVGRFLYVIGSNPRTAELSGIRVPRYVLGAFIFSGLCASFAGVVLAARIHVGNSAIGSEMLLPAFTAAMLGTTTIRPGRVNPLGTLFAVLVLAVAVAGLQQMGASFYVEPLFNGLMLLIAVGLAVAASRRRVTSAASETLQDAVSPVAASGARSGADDVRIDR